MLNAMRLDADRAMLLVIDFQDKLLPFIHNRQDALVAAEFLIRGCAIFELPVLVTEQYPKGVGATDAGVAQALGEAYEGLLEKTSFSCCGDDAIRASLRRIDRQQIIVTGIEAHVCVQQTVLDLLSMDYQVFLCADAVGSRTPMDYSTALDRMGRAGAIITTAESVLFELCVACDDPRFKRLIEHVKARPI